MPVHHVPSSSPPRPAHAAPAFTSARVPWGARTLPLARRATTDAEPARVLGVACLRHVLAGTFLLRDLYRMHHWHGHDGAFYQLHLLYDQHYTEQAGLADVLAERVHLLGGHAVGGAAAVTAPMTGEEPEAQLSRLQALHQQLIACIRWSAQTIAGAGDEGSAVLLRRTVLHTNELQSWIIAQHLPEERRQ